MNKFRMAKAGVDVNQGLQRLCGDSALYEQMLIRFLDDTHYEQFKEQLKAGDAAAAFQAAHALKGIAGNISLVKLYDAIVPIVEVLRAGSLAVDEYLPAAEEAYQKVTAAIREMAEK